ncbi:MAG: hypothetical protein QE278_09795 [Limnobacter sp.]|nr:hypothetical protein [Limnobacter sp.]
MTRLESLGALMQTTILPEPPAFTFKQDKKKKKFITNTVECCSFWHY